LTRNTLILTIALIPQLLCAQSPTKITLNFEVDSLIVHTPNDTIHITNLKFYISNIQLLQAKDTLWTEPNSHHLIDILSPTTTTNTLNYNGKFDAIQFNLGIDSTTNEAGAQGKDLDPTKGMYWTWQSGYINFKLEGISKLCPTRKHQFQFHLGGYTAPNNAIQTITLPISNPTQKISLQIHLAQLFKSIDLTKQNEIMSPSQEAVVLAQLIAKAFRVK
jgi:hypothetical protein